MSKKLEIDFIRKEFSKNGYTLLTTTYVNNKHKLEYICPKGHKGSINWNNFQSGQRCRICKLEEIADGRRYNINYIRKQFEKEGYKLLSKEYRNEYQKLEYICPKGHRDSIRWNDFQQGKRCAECRRCKKKTIEFIRNQFEKEGYQLLSTEYKNNCQKLDYICPKGHRGSIAWGNFKSGYRCPVCSGNAKKSIAFIKAEMKKENYILLSTEYKNSEQKLKYMCPKGHKHSMSWKSWNRGYRCPYCSKKAKKTIDEIKQAFEKEGYILLTSEYKNNKQKLDFICPQNHRYRITWNRWLQGQRCKKCSILNRIKYYTPEQLREYKNYRKRVQYITNENFRKYYYEINPLGLPRGNEYHVDHIYSVIDGFINNIDAEIICNPFNLQMLSAFDNRSKNGRSDMSIDELYFLYTYFTDTIQKGV